LLLKCFLFCSVLLSAFVLSALSSYAGLPVGTEAYDDLEYLELKGLLPSAILSTKPISRREMRRLLREARTGLPRHTRSAPSSSVPMLLKRLENRFDTESGRHFNSSVYAKALYSENAPEFSGVNNNGDGPGAGFNARLGARLEGNVGGISLYLNPELRAGEGTATGELVEGYAEFELGPVEIVAGREAMWWGPGAHGALLISNNAAPLDLVRATTTHPAPLPWILSPLGLFKPTFFLARLEENRDFPNANLLGMRLDFKPTPRFRFALSRVFMFGGEGRGSRTG